MDLSNEIIKNPPTNSEVLWEKYRMLEALIKQCIYAEMEKTNFVYDDSEEITDLYMQFGEDHFNSRVVSIKNKEKNIIIVNDYSEEMNIENTVLSLGDLIGIVQFIELVKK